MFELQFGQFMILLKRVKKRNEIIRQKLDYNHYL